MTFLPQYSKFVSDLNYLIIFRGGYNEWKNPISLIMRNGILCLHVKN